VILPTSARLFADTFPRSPAGGVSASCSTRHTPRGFTLYVFTHHASACHASQVGEPQLRTLRAEFGRGVEVCGAVHRGEAKWEDLVRPNDFFRRYKYVALLVHCS